MAHVDPGGRQVHRASRVRRHHQRRAVTRSGLQGDDLPVTGDWDGSGRTTATDALAVLRVAVELPGTPNCPPEEVL